MTIKHWAILLKVCCNERLSLIIMFPFDKYLASKTANMNFYIKVLTDYISKTKIQVLSNVLSPQFTVPLDFHFLLTIQSSFFPFHTFLQLMNTASKFFYQRKFRVCYFFFSSLQLGLPPERLRVTETDNCLLTFK